MTQSEHTPGPWFEAATIGEYTGIRAPGIKDPIAWVDFVKNEDFRLTLAASELLEALEIAQDYFNLMESIVNSTCEDHRADMLKKRTVNDLTLDDLFELYRVKAKAAIDKARGPL